MDRTVLPDNRGISLIELMIALLLLMIVSLALMQTALLGITSNLRNALRDEAVQIADQRMNELRSVPFTSGLLSATPADGTVETGIERVFRSSRFVFTPTRIVTNINANSKQITVTIAWNYRNVTYHHGVTSILAGNQ